MLLPILYEDDNYVAIDKPSGLLVHRTKLDRHATEFALQILRDQLGREVFPCHRLDRPTSGVLLFALNNATLRFAQKQFAEQKAAKEYLAVVRGWTEDRGDIDYDLRSEENPGKSQPALTEYTCLSRTQLELPAGRYACARFSLLKLQPKTGRKHQLRRHLAHIRHPIMGDTRHGDGAQNRFLREHFGVHRLLLRATRLEMDMPHSSKRLCITANKETEFEQLLGPLGLD
jgi:tRNA pseudouridine65 synthase